MPDESLSITSRYYILDDAKNPVPEPDVLRWATWFENADRKIALTQIGGAEVSTVFLGMDHVGQADLIHNTASIVEHDPDFARVYLREKAELIEVLVRADTTLLERALGQIREFSGVAHR